MVTVDRTECIWKLEFYFSKIILKRTKLYLTTLVKKEIKKCKKMCLSI